MFGKFLKRNLEFAERESFSQDDEKKYDMAALVAQGSQAMGELGDQLSGARKLKNHQHHRAQDLTQAVIDDISAIITLRKEIQKKKG